VQVWCIGVSVMDATVSRTRDRPLFERLDPQQRGCAVGRVDAEEAAGGQHVEQAVRPLLNVANTPSEASEQPFPALLEPLSVEFDSLEVTGSLDAPGHE